MKSIPAASAMRASRRQSGQLADQRSGTRVADRPDEQLAPNRPILRWLAVCIAMRSRIDAVRAGAAGCIYDSPAGAEPPKRHRTLVGSRPGLRGMIRGGRLIVNRPR